MFRVQNYFGFTVDSSVNCCGFSQLFKLSSTDEFVVGSKCVCVYVHHRTVPVRVEPKATRTLFLSSVGVECIILVVLLRAET